MNDFLLDLVFDRDMLKEILPSVSSVPEEIFIGTRLRYPVQPGRFGEESAFGISREEIIKIVSETNKWTLTGLTDEIKAILRRNGFGVINGFVSVEVNPEEDLHFRKAEEWFSGRGVCIAIIFIHSPYPGHIIHYPLQ